MQHIIALDPDALQPGEAGPALISPGSGCQAYLTRGGSEQASHAAPFDRLVFVLRGEPHVTGPEGMCATGPESLIFIPAGSVLAIQAGPQDYWIEFQLTDACHSATQVVPAPPPATSSGVQLITVDQSRFEGEGFAFQNMLDRSTGSEHVRVNMLRVEPGAGSPDFHIHDFDQFYVILQGEMHLDIGRNRQVAGPMSLVQLPAGLVHRNFNPGPGEERHISLLVPEPAAGAVFDYAIDIYEKEAAMLKDIPKPLA